jgi:hypothetical protein
MKRKVLAIFAILLLLVLTTSAFAQSSPSDEGTRAGPGMMYQQSQGQGQDAYGPGMMYGYGVGWMGGYGGTWVAILLVILGAGVVAWIVKLKRQVDET